MISFSEFTNLAATWKASQAGTQEPTNRNSKLVHNNSNNPFLQVVSLLLLPPFD